MRGPKNEIGNTYMRLTILSGAPSKGNKAMWECICSCGVKVTVSGDSLRRGQVKSCGCYRRSGDYVRSHGHSNSGGLKRESPTYKSWQEMHRRCSSPTHISYKNYGAKGVSVCPEWGDFKVFLSEMGERPKGASLDRVHNFARYCKENCRWSDRVTQNRNRSLVLPIEYQGRTQCLAAWCADLNLPYPRMYYRVVVRGLPPTVAFLLSPQPRVKLPIDMEEK